jgi:serine/threonine protein kinase
VQWTCIPGTFTPEEIEILERRVQELTALLREPERPTSLPLPMCYGYLKEDPTDFALVYSLPAHADPLERPKSLYSLFPQNTESVKVPGQVRVLPDLAVRYRLARTLAEGLLVLHSIRWLHKAFNSGNILLFVGPSGLEVTKPMLSGFGLGRSASHEQQTIDLRGFKSKFALYQHPELRCETHRRYEARHDIYSLGMVLVEIAFWQNLHLFTKDGQDAEDFRQMIISLCHKSLGHRMGKRYCSVVLNCIDNDDCWTTAEANGDSSPASLDNFTWKVVKELGKCHCVI